MGLDLVVEGCPKPGHEAEWRRIVSRSFAEDTLSEAEVGRFSEISTPGYERIGAPRVGSDSAADAWILNVREANTPEQVTATLREFAGYHVVRLVECDGVPLYSNGGLYDGVDETSFRGAFLQDCTNVIDKELLDAAWHHKMPEAAVAYGRLLISAADTAEQAPLTERRGFLSRIGLKKSAELLPLSEQLDIVRAAGRWYLFWGELGHPVRAYF